MNSFKNDSEPKVCKYIGLISTKKYRIYYIIILKNRISGDT